MRELLLDFSAPSASRRAPPPLRFWLLPLSSIGSRARPLQLRPPRAGSCAGRRPISSVLDAIKPNIKRRSWAPLHSPTAGSALSGGRHAPPESNRPRRLPKERIQARWQCGLERGALARRRGSCGLLRKQGIDLREYDIAEREWLWPNETRPNPTNASTGLKDLRTLDHWVNKIETNASRNMTNLRVEYPTLVVTVCVAPRAFLRRG